MAPPGTKVDLRKAAFLFACMGVGTLLWDYPVLFPLKLLVVAMHETGHALASLLVGGSVERISLTGNEAGQCLALLPQGVLRQVVVYSAGYMGSALAGALLLLATFRYRLRRVMLGGMSAWLAAMGLLYGRDGFTLLFCLGGAIAFGLAARFLPDGAADALNLFLAAFSSLYAVIDLRNDLWDSAVRSQSDAALLARITYVPSVVWAALWTLGSLAILLLVGRLALRRGLAAPVPVALPGGRP